MRKKVTKTAEPSAASLREMPEVDLSHARPVRREHVERVRRSMATIVVTRKTLDLLGGADAAREILDAVAHSIDATKKKRRGPRAA